MDCDITTLVKSDSFAFSANSMFLFDTVRPFSVKLGFFVIKFVSFGLFRMLTTLVMFNLSEIGMAIKIDLFSVDYRRFGGGDRMPVHRGSEEKTLGIGIVHFTLKFCIK